MQEQVAQLVPERDRVTNPNRLIQFEHFLDEVGPERLRGLRPVPGAPRAQGTDEDQSTSKR